MHIVLNGERREVRDGQTLLELLDGLEIPRDAVVVEHNGVIVDRAAYGETKLASGDSVELVRFVGGG